MTRLFQAAGCCRNTEKSSIMSTALIGTGGLGSVIAGRLAAGGETLRLSSADHESARKLAEKLGGSAMVATDNHDVLEGTGCRDPRAALRRVEERHRRNR